MNNLCVAPYAGAWIEMNVFDVSDFNQLQVAPYAGAWIEIIAVIPAFSLASSLPTRERGLKFVYHIAYFVLWMSLPTRERGLKCPTASCEIKPP